MTVADLCDKLQSIAHSGDAQKEMKNINDILVREDGVYIIVDQNKVDERVPSGVVN